MAGFNFGNFSAALAETEQQATGDQEAEDSGPQTGVSFESKACNWGTAEEASAVIEAINACPHLEHLNLEGNTLGVAAAQAIGRALERHPEMKRALWKDLFTGRLKTEIPLALESMGRGMTAAGAQLAVLDCSDNALGPNGMKGLVELLKSSTCYSLKELKLNNCGLGIQGATMLAASLTHCLQSAAAANPARPFQLRCFIAGRNRLENEGARALATVFGRLGTLEELAIPQNGINHEGITALATALRQNVSLRVLNLNDNTITAKGARSLAAALGSLQQLRDLNLGDCLLRNAGAELLGEALLEGHAELRSVNLGYNEIGPNGGMSVTGAMQPKRHLQTLILNGNRFGQEYREYISEMLAECDQLHVLGELDEDDSDNESCDGDAAEGGGGAGKGDYGGEGDGGDEDDDDYEDVDEDEDEYGDDDDDDDDDDDEDDEDGRRYVNQTLERSGAAGGSGGGGGSASKSRTLDASAVNFSFNLHSTSGGAGAAGAAAAANTSAANSSAFFNGTDTSITVGDSPVETFCLTAHPTVALFADIADDDKVAAFRTYLASLSDAEYQLHLCFAVLKTSAISKLCPAALEVSAELYRDCFEHARESGQLQRVQTFFLTQLGLLRMEEKTWRPAYDVGACRAAVRHAIGGGMVSEEVGAVFGLFLERV